MVQVDHGAGTTGWPAGLDGSEIHRGYPPRPAQLPSRAKSMNVYSSGMRPYSDLSVAMTDRAQLATAPGARLSVTSRSRAIPSPSSTPSLFSWRMNHEADAAALTEGRAYM